MSHPKHPSVHRAPLPECAHLSPAERLHAIADILARGIVRTLTCPDESRPTNVAPERDDDLMVRENRAHIGERPESRPRRERNLDGERRK